MKGASLWTSIPFSYVESQIASGHTVGFVIFVVVLLALLGVGIQVFA